MKTQIIHKSMLLILVMVVQHSLSLQSQIIAKSAVVTVSAGKNYESSKQKLLNALDSCSCKLYSINETKTNNGNQKVIIELLADDKGFKTIDQLLPSLGYISFKNLKSEDKSVELDTAELDNDLLFQKQNKIKYEQKYAGMKKDSDAANEFWKKINQSDSLIYVKTKTLSVKRQKLLFLHKMQVTINE